MMIRNMTQGYCFQGSAVIQAFERQIWCLTEECAVFSLFSNRLPDSEQQNIALRLNRTLVPSSKTVRHDFQCLTTQQSSLTSLVPNNYYWLLFHSLKANTAWLTQSQCRRS